MKKKSGSRIERIITRIVNIRTWFDWERVRSFTVFLIQGFKRLFVPQQSAESESFDEAVSELKLTSTDLLIKQKALYRLSLVMLATAVLILGYVAYQLFWGSFKAALLSFVVMMIALVLAFRYHFWYFQIKEHKLGCTFQEWFRQGLLGEHDE